MTVRFSAIKLSNDNPSELRKYHRQTCASPQEADTRTAYIEDGLLQDELNQNANPPGDFEVSLEIGKNGKPVATVKDANGAELGTRNAIATSPAETVRQAIDEFVLGKWQPSQR